MGIIELKEVNKIYDMGLIQVNALNDISVSINEKSFVSFIGPSGSGKTTLLNLIGVIDKPTEGDIYIKNIRVNDFNLRESARFRGNNLGFIFQNFNLLPVLTVFENVEYPLLMVQNVSKSERRKRVLYYLEAVGMLDQKNKFPSEISGGQKQRAAIARALVTNPSVVLADEPTANLDSDSAYKVINLMKQMKNDMNTTFIFSTHDPKIVKEAEIIYALEDGRIKETKTLTN
ncbi:ABC transporter ATP-binding protein [candidate division KSB1 bacterium]